MVYVWWHSTVKWREKLSEMSAWVDLQMIRSGATIESVLKEFVTRFTGSLGDWFDSLGPYRQLQFVQLPNVSSGLAIHTWLPKSLCRSHGSSFQSLWTVHLHVHRNDARHWCLREPSVVFEAARRDYLNMKSCSLFYKLNRFNDHTLKHVFLASLPTELQLKIQRQLTVHNLNLDNISLGKIFQIAKGCLEKLCEQNSSSKNW